MKRIILVFIFTAFCLTPVSAQEVRDKDAQNISAIDIPFVLELTTDKKVYSSDEKITLTVTLTNNSDKAFEFKDFDEKTLYIRYGQKEWGTPETGYAQAENIKKIILGPGESMSRIFVIRGFRTSQDVDFFASYAMTYKGIHPSSRIKVRIQSDY